MARRPIMDVIRDSGIPPVPPEDRSVEEMISDEVRKYAPKPHVNSLEMNRVQGILSNGVTAAHSDACSAVDKVVDEAKALLGRLVIASEAHKARLRQEGEEIACKLEAAVQELTRAVEWAEQCGASLRSPELRPAALPAPKSLEADLAAMSEGEG